MASVSSPYLGFPFGLGLGTVSQIKLVLHNLLLIMVFYPSNRKQARLFVLRGCLFIHISAHLYTYTFIYPLNALIYCILLPTTYAFSPALLVKESGRLFPNLFVDASTNNTPTFPGAGETANSFFSCIPNFAFLVESFPMAFTFVRSLLKPIPSP